MWSKAAGRWSIVQEGRTKVLDNKVCVVRDRQVVDSYMQDGLSEESVESIGRVKSVIQ